MLEYFQGCIHIWVSVQVSALHAAAAVLQAVPFRLAALLSPACGRHCIRYRAKRLEAVIGVLQHVCTPNQRHCRLMPWSVTHSALIMQVPHELPMCSFCGLT